MMDILLSDLLQQALSNGAPHQQLLHLGSADHGRVRWVLGLSYIQAVIKSFSPHVHYLAAAAAATLLLLLLLLLPAGCAGFVLRSRWWWQGSVHWGGLGQLELAAGGV
jgi:hypothetical protein